MSERFREFALFKSASTLPPFQCQIGEVRRYSDCLDAVPTTTHFITLSSIRSTGSEVNRYCAAAWVIEAARQLEELGKLPQGWDSYGGERLKKEARTNTVKAINWICTKELPAPSVVLCSNGTVQLEWRKSGKELDIDLRDGNSIEFVKCTPDGDIEEGVEYFSIQEKVESLVDWLAPA